MRTAAIGRPPRRWPDHRRRGLRAPDAPPTTTTPTAITTAITRAQRPECLGSDDWTMRSPCSRLIANDVLRGSPDGLGQSSIALDSLLGGRRSYAVSRSIDERNESARNPRQIRRIGGVADKHALLLLHSEDLCSGADEQQQHVHHRRVFGDVGDVADEVTRAGGWRTRRYGPCVFMPGFAATIPNERPSVPRLSSATATPASCRASQAAGAAAGRRPRQEHRETSHRRRQPRQAPRADLGRRPADEEERSDPAFEQRRAQARRLAGRAPAVEVRPREASEQGHEQAASEQAYEAYTHHVEPRSRFALPAPAKGLAWMA